MKVINTGVRFDIYPDNLKSFNELPADYYVVRFSEKEGFFLEQYTEFVISDAKIYGIQPKKVEKVINTFRLFNRNLGVILSGDKGIGKSLFSRLLGRKAVENGYPVIIVDKYEEGIGNFLDRIQQEVMVLLDEFDKVFSEKEYGAAAQTSLLSLFDGVSQGKKLFVVTCNELKGLNDFLVNRPGRFHYHFRFDYPAEDDIREYLSDALKTEYSPEIDSVIDFSKRVALNYDCLRAIAFEINMGQDFSSAIQDLNIINIDEERFRIKVLFKDGTVLINNRVLMDSFSNEMINTSLKDFSGNYAGNVSFRPSQMKYNSGMSELYINVDDIALDYDDYYLDDNECEEKAKALRAKGVNKVVVERIIGDRIHYVV